MQTEISYGKHHVTIYRTYAAPLAGVKAIPESAFRGRSNTLFALDLDVDVIGDNFLPAYTEGDNGNVVATDSMKNFVLRETLNYSGATLEGLLAFLGRRFLETYPQMQTLRLTGREQPFAAASVPGNDGFHASEVLFSHQRGDHATALVELVRDDDGVSVSDHQCGLAAMQLIKITGSAFADFVRDGYTTLPEVRDRPLFIYLDMQWRYADARDALGSDAARYVPAEQVRDLVQHTFHSFVSMSIQQLVYEMGTRLLGRFPQLTEVSFTGQNRTWDTAATSESNPQIKAYTDPRPGHGNITLTMKR
ncbi:MAG: urate oxidase [Chloroflexaceae bacterium]|jgi:urate oxidase|nr:urate oxidase [Chloroflexaceae bacterium]